MSTAPKVLAGIAKKESVLKRKSMPVSKTKKVHANNSSGMRSFAPKSKKINSSKKNGIVNSATAHNAVKLKMKLDSLQKCNSKKGKPTFSSVPSSFILPRSLQVLSRFRFPSDPRALASGVARFAGMVFVCLGAGASFLYLHTAQYYTITHDASGSLSAQLLSATASTSPIAITGESGSFESTATASLDSNTTVSPTNTTYDSNTHAEATLKTEVNDSDSTTVTSQSVTDTASSVEGESLTSVSTVQQFPPVTLYVPNEGALSGVVTLHISVSGATSVKLSAFYEGWQQNISLGSARKENNAWVYSWDTRKNENGFYRLKVLVTNEFGSYEYVHTTKVSINNDKMLVNEPVTQNVIEDTQSNDNVTSEQLGEERTVFLKDEDQDSNVETKPDSKESPLRFSYNKTSKQITLQKIYPEVLSNDVVRIYISQTGSDVKFLVAEAYLFGLAFSRYNVNWTRTFDASRFPPGVYIVSAERFRGTELLNFDTVGVTLSHEVSGQVRSSPVQAVTVSPSAEASARLQVDNPSALSGYEDIVITANDALSVDVYAINTASVNQIYLGSARQKNASSWIYVLDTTQLPNSQYHIFAKVTNTRGTYEGNRVLVTVRNERYSSVSQNQINELEKRKNIYQTLIAGSIFSPDNFWNLSAVTTAPKIAEFISNFSIQLNQELQKYASSIRSGNEQTVQASESRLLEIENEFISSVVNEPDAEELKIAFSDYIDTTKKRIQSDVKKVETVLNERSKTNQFVDSDWDGISDFDEIFIYGTDPFQADTSGNGIPDGVAILNGLDPLSTDRDASIVFESPLDVGVIREDILTVESITEVAVDEENVSSTFAPAVITGTALPNSFVTVYIFSSPIIVTVRTEHDGSWQYRFEKELPDGEHTVFVAITDNSGRIIARSLPFFFAKEARAYTPLGNSLPELEGRRVQDSSIGFFSSSIIYLVLALAVVAIGLVLLLLGLFLERRKVQTVLTIDPLA